MSKRIKIEQVEIGMFLEDVFDESGRILYAENTLISDMAQVERLKKRGIQNVYINTDKGADIAPEAIPDSATEDISFDDSFREAAYYKEIERAKEIHDKTVQTVRETLSSARVGKSFSAQNIERAAEEIVESIMRNPDALVSLCQIKGHDEYTFEHSLHVGILISSLSHEMHLGADTVLQSGIGGLLHDIGKMRVPERILNKPGKYEPWEFKVMKKHPADGVALLKENKIALSETAKAIVGQHHERFNGSGYPAGLRGKAIHEAALMSGVADVYDALTTDRVYREAWTPQKALATIFQGCDKQYSRTVVERFTRHLGIYPVGSFVKLRSGELAVVTRVNAGHIMAPEVVVLIDAQHKWLRKPYTADLFKRQQEPGGEKYQIVISVDPKQFNVKVADYISRY